MSKEGSDVSKVGSDMSKKGSDVSKEGSDAKKNLKKDIKEWTVWAEIKLFHKYFMLFRANLIKL